MTKDFVPHEYFAGKELKTKPLNDYWDKIIFVEEICPECGKHLMKTGICLNWCHLGPEGKAAKEQEFLPSKPPEKPKEKKHGQRRKRA